MIQKQQGCLTSKANLGTIKILMKRGETNRRACFFLGLVVIARAKHPVPSRTRPLSAVAPMVLRLKTWESRSPPNLERNTKIPLPKRYQLPQSDINGAGWSSPVARQAHNLKDAGSNPAPATKILKHIKDLRSALRGAFCIHPFTSTPHQHQNRKTAPERSSGHRHAAAGIGSGGRNG